LEDQTEAKGAAHRADTAEDRAARRSAELKDPLEIRCQFCSGQSFRRSRLRGIHLIELLRMRYPVRCLRCNQRQMVNFTIAGLSLASTSRRGRASEKPHASWAEWTEGSAPARPDLARGGPLPVFVENTPAGDGAGAPRVATQKPVDSDAPAVERRKNPGARSRRRDDESVW
jgi:hypothetical protein